MIDSNPQTTLKVNGRKLDVSQGSNIVAEEYAGIIQATPRVGAAIELAGFALKRSNP